MRIGIIGTGGIAQLHARILLELGHRIVFAVNQNIEKLKRFQHQYQVEQIHQQIEETLIYQPDCVIICTPPTSHYAIAKFYLQNKVPLICEKPLTLEPEQAFELIELANQKQCLVGVNFNNRYYPSVQALKDMLASPNQAPPLYINASYDQEFHILPVAYSWRFDSSAGAKMRAVTEIGSHILDLVTYLTGDRIKQVSASFITAQAKGYIKQNTIYQEPTPESVALTISSEDIAVITVKMEKIGVVSIRLSENYAGKSNQIKLEILSQKDSWQWDNEQPDYLTNGKKGQGLVSTQHSVGVGFEDTFRAFLTEFLQDVASGQRSKTSRYAGLEEAAVNVAICDRIYQSGVDKGRWVAVEAIQTDIPEKQATDSKREVVAQLINRHQLEKMPIEGAYVKRSYTAKVDEQGYPLATSMIGLYIADQSKSCFHQLSCDEIWTFLEGDALELYLLHPAGKTEVVRLGSNPAEGERLQYVVSAGTWQAGQTVTGGVYSLFSCTCIPGFRPDLFVAGEPNQLVEQYPAMKEMILELNKDIMCNTLPDDYKG